MKEESLKERLIGALHNYQLRRSALLSSAGNSFVLWTNEDRELLQKLSAEELIEITVKLVERTRFWYNSSEDNPRTLSSVASPLCHLFLGACIVCPYGQTRCLESISKLKENPTLDPDVISELLELYCEIEKCQTV